MAHQPFFRSVLGWVKGTLSDGGKPSMARHLLIPLTAGLLYCVVTQKPVPDNFTEIYIANVAWAGGGAAVLRWTRSKTDDLKEKVEGQ